MKVFILISVISLVSTASSKSLPEEDSVVSVYTTLPTTAGTGPGPALDVYQQIANNIAQRITSPIYRFLGLNQSSTDTNTKQPSLKIELLEDSPNDVTKTIRPIDNNSIDKVEKFRDVEELSVEASRRSDIKKPEKITLYSSYLPVTGSLKRNDSINEVNDNDDDDFNFDDVEKDEPATRRGGPFVFILEWIASAAQIAYGFFEALLRPKVK